MNKEYKNINEINDIEELRKRYNLMLNRFDTELFKYKEVLDKIKEIAKENIDDEFYINLTNKEKALYKINNLLEEIE